MKITKRILFILSLSFLTFSQLIAQEGDIYEQRLNSLIEKGVISKTEARSQLAQINSQNQKTFHRQVRGVASKIKEAKVYEIVNDPLEIPSH